MGRLTLVGTGVHDNRTNASSGREWYARIRNVSPGCTTGITALSWKPESSTRHAKQFTPETLTWCAGPSPTFTICAAKYLIPKKALSCEMRCSRVANSHSAVGLLRACAHRMKPVETAVATVAADVVTAQKFAQSMHRSIPDPRATRP